MKRFELTGWKGAVASWYVISCLVTGFFAQWAFIIPHIAFLIQHFL